MRVEDRLQANYDGLCHDNYFFTAGGSFVPYTFVPPPAVTVTVAFVMLKVPGTRLTV